MPNRQLSDGEFIEAFESARLFSHEFKHIDHIRMAWIYLSAARPEQAAAQIREGIRHFANVHGATQLYHETITLFWVYAVQAAMEKTRAGSFAEFFEANEYLGDKEYIRKFYSRDALMSPEAKMNWLEPDLRPLEEMKQGVA